MENFITDYKENLIQQYELCSAYRLLCENVGFNPNMDLVTEDDLEKVPYLTTTLFKKSQGLFSKLLRIPVENLDKWTVSSSTSGDPSIVGRVNRDIEQIEEFTEKAKDTLRPLVSDECVFYPEPDLMKRYKSEIIMGKQTESYMGNMLDVFEFGERALFLVEEDKDNDALTVNMDKFKKLLISNDGKNKFLAIRGSTILIYNAVKELMENMKPLNLGENVVIHTGGGGWDGKKGTLSTGIELKRKAFVETISEFLGIPEENFIDSYSFTENSFPINGHYSKEFQDYLFHVPNWGRVIIRDIKTLKPLRNQGDRGFIEMLNAYGTSAFAGASILVDDIGEIVSNYKCPCCGEDMMTIKIIGRVKGAEAKGCGATLNVRRSNNGN